MVCRSLGSLVRLACVLVVLAAPAAAGGAWVEEPPGQEIPTIGWSGPVLDAPDPEADPAAWRVERPASAFYLAALEAAGASDVSASPPSQAPHWSSLPFFSEKARELGYELPLPFGVAAAYNYVARDVVVTDIRVGIDGAPLSSVSQVVNFKARSYVDAFVVKTDAWLFPFLNVYALLGYIKNRTDLNVQVTVPRPPPFSGSRQFTIKTRTQLEGFVGGAGATLAAGYRQFFGMVDANYSQTDLGFDDRFRALIASTRIGWNGSIGLVPVRLWVGGSYWDTVNTAKATVEVPDVGAVSFEADQGPKHAWNGLVGASVVFHRHLDAFVEYGFRPGDVTIFVGGLTLRF
jgi:hypothetical protein